MINNNALSISPPADLAEQVAIAGDLAQLTAQQRMAYYSRVCDSFSRPEVNDGIKRPSRQMR